MSDRRDRYVLLCQQALVLAVVTAVAAPAAGIVTLDIVSPSSPAAGRIAAIGAPEPAALVATEPVRATVREIPMTAPIGGRAPGLGAAPGSARQIGGADTSVVTAPERVGGFATVGVTWGQDQPAGEGELSLSVRTRTATGWSPWQPMEFHDDHAPDPDSPDAATSRAGTEAYVVGDVDDVQVKASTTTDALPADLRLAVVDPGATAAARVERPAIDTAHLTAFESGDPADPGDITDPTDPGEPVTPPDDPALTPVAGIGVTPQPKIFSRAQWGADERMRDKSSLRYGEVHAGFVHHTVNANDYTRAQVPAILRGIYAYHTQSRGWSDVGYNFLVDRFGRIWEGRYGGVGRPAVGAHTLGYNEYAFAMSAIGNFETAKPSAAMIDAYARLFAWKLSLHGVQASSTRQFVGSRYFQAINGHRDAGSTACPGRYLYAQLPRIRALTASYQRSFASRNLRTNISGTTWPDLVVRDAATNRMSVVRTGGQVRFLRRVPIASGFGDMDLIVAPGDLTGDGYADVIARQRTSGLSGIYPGSATGKLGAAIRTTERFDGVDLLVGVGDFNGDRRGDLVGRVAATQELVLYPGQGGGTFGGAVVLAENWSGYTLTAGVGNFDRSGGVDLVARDGAGRLFLVPGAGNQLGAPRQIGSGFQVFDLVAGRGDLTGDGFADLVVREASSKLTRVYTGSAAGGLGTYYGPYPRLRNINWAVAGGQFAGSASIDLLGRNNKGTLLAYPNSGGRNIEAVVKTSVSLAGTNLLLNVGDWNHDGFGDVMTRTTAGQMQLRLGRGADTFAAPVVAASGWGGFRQVVSVGDITGDGHNDLMGRPGNDGPFMIWPGNGSTGLAAGYEAHSAFASNRQVAVGLYDGDGAPDTMTTKRDGTVYLFPGNGPGGMTSGRLVGAGVQGYDWLVGLGDLDGDRRNDLIGRSRATGWLYLIPGTATGFGRARLIAPGFSGYDLAG